MASLPYPRNQPSVLISAIRGRTVFPQNAEFIEFQTRTICENL